MGSRKKILGILLFVSGASAVSPLDITMDGRLLVFDSGIAQAIEEVTDYPFIESPYNFIGTLWIYQRYTDWLGFALEVEHDPILMDRLFAWVCLDVRFLSIQAGPFIGFLNSTALVNPGFSIIMNSTISSLIFGSFRLDATVNSALLNPGDYTQKDTEIALGFRLPFITFTGSAGARSYQERKETLIIGVQRIRYQLSVENQQKTAFYTAHGYLGYQELLWTASSAGMPETYQLNSIYAGIELTFRLWSFLWVHVGVEMPLYSKSPQIARMPNLAFYQCTLGLTWSFVPAR